MKVLILSANIGEGHATAARAIKQQLERDDSIEATILNAPEHMGRVIQHQIESGYEKQLRKHPRLYAFNYALVMRLAPTRWLAQFLLGFFANRPLLALIQELEPDAIVSTYPAATVLLGKMRSSGKIACPLYAAITDISGLHFWAHRGVDRHLVVHPEALEEVERIAGKGSAELVNPLVAEEFFEPVDRAQARRALGLDQAARIVTVSGGGWGVGDLSGAVRAVLATDPRAEVVVVAGRSDQVRSALLSEFGADSRVRVIGFCERMRDLLAASDLLVHSTGGVTVVESALVGCPSISYGLPVGHIVHNVRALERAGHTSVALCADELVDRLGDQLQAVGSPPLVWPRAVPAATVVASAGHRVQSHSPLRVRSSRLAARTAMFAAVALFVFSSGDTYSLASRALPIKPTDRGSSAGGRIGLVIDAPGQLHAGIAAQLRAQGLGSSFLVSERSADRQAAAGDGSLVIAAASHGRLGWVKLRSRIPEPAPSNPASRSYYLVTSGDTSLGQLLLARSRQAKLIRPARVVIAGYQFRPNEIEPGEIVELRVSAAQPDPSRAFAATLASALAAGLTPATIDSLFSLGSAAAATKREVAKAAAPAMTRQKPSNNPSSPPRS